MAKKPSEEEFLEAALNEQELEAAKAVEAEPEEEAVEEEPAPEAEKATDEPKMIDERAVQEARAENRRLRQEKALLEERTNMLLERFAPQPQKEPEKAEPDDPEPDRNVDLFAHNEWLSRQLAKTGQTVKELREEREKEKEQYKQEDEQAQVAQQLESYWNTSHAEYKEKNPEFEKAQEWSVREMDRLYRMQAMRNPEYNDPAFRRQLIINDTLALTYQAAQQGRNAAEMMYEMAVANGYTPETAAPATTGPAAIAEKSDRTQRHMSLSDASGGAAPRKLDAKALASMSQKDFNKMMSADPAEVDDIMGIAG